VTGQLTIGIGVDPDLDRLAGAHVGELRFLVIRDHPDFVRHEHHQALASGREGADRAAQLDDAAGLSRHDIGISEIEFCLVELRLRLLQRGARAFELRLQRLDSDLRSDHCSLGTRRIGLLRL
jgi:hypothetical protein